MGYNLIILTIHPNAGFFLHFCIIIRYRLKNNQRRLRNKLCTQVEPTSYCTVMRVMVKTECATSSALFDLYPIRTAEEYHIAVFDEDINSLRTFEGNLINPVSANKFLPDKHSIMRLRHQWRQQIDVHCSLEHIYRPVLLSTYPADAEYWEPILFLLHYFPAQTLTMNTDNFKNATMRFFKNIRQRYQPQHLKLMRPLLMTDTLWVRIDELLFAKLKPGTRTALETDELAPRTAKTNWSYLALANLLMQAQHTLPVANFYSFSANFAGSLICWVASESFCKPLQELLSRITLCNSLIQKPSRHNR